MTADAFSGPCTVSRPGLFVTGASGFVGRAFVRDHAREFDIVALARPAAAQMLRDLGATVVGGDLASVRATDFGDGQTLVHFASAGVNPAAGQSWEEIFKVNVLDTVHCWRQAVGAGVKRFVVIGSCSEYGLTAEREEFVSANSPLAPNSAYGASKAAAGLAAHALASEYGVGVKLLRLFHVYGEGEAAHRFWPSLREAALAGRDFDMTAGEQVRDFVHVDEVSRQLRRHVLDPFTGAGEFVCENIGSGRPQTLRAFAEHWWKAFGATGKLRPGRVPYRANEIMRFVPRLPA